MLRERPEAAEEHFLVSGETGLQYDAVRIANFTRLACPPHYAGDVESRFARSFRAAWQAEGEPGPADVLAWVADTLPFRDPARAGFVRRGLEQRLREFWSAS